MGRKMTYSSPSSPSAESASSDRYTNISKVRANRRNFLLRLRDQVLGWVAVVVVIVIVVVVVVVIVVVIVIVVAAAAAAARVQLPQQHFE